MPVDHETIEMKYSPQSNSLFSQQGAAVLLVSIILLIGVSLITIFAARVGVMDQRISGNEYRHKEAKASADAALEQAAGFIKQNPDLYEGTGGDWTDCNASTALQNTFPCHVKLSNVTSVYYDKVYSSVSGTVISPLAYTTSLPSNIDSDSYIVFTASNTAGNILTAVARGSSLDGTADSVAQIAYSQVEILNPGEIPPVMASVIDINGSFTIVADPNSGVKNGVPISAWVSSLSGAGTGSWQTCSLGSYKNGTTVCGEDPTAVNPGFDETQTGNTGWGGCACEPGDFLSTNSDVGYDIFEDTTNFPSDIFKYVFNGLNQAQIKAIADHVIADCTGLASLNLQGAPLVWVEGDCTIPADVGTRAAPIILVVDGLLKINSNHNVWGILVSLVDISLSGGPIIHGSIVSDSNSKLSAGGYTQVFDPFVLDSLVDPSVNTKLSKIKYTWTDLTN